MSKYIIKIIDQKENKNYYLEWSSIIDAPVTHGMNLKTFKKYYKKKYGTSSMILLKERLKRVEKQGTSAIGNKLEDILCYNRAGEKETTLNKEQILNKYCQTKKQTKLF